MTTRKAILCFMLVVCIAVLSACTAPPNINSGETTGQSTGDTIQNTQNAKVEFNWDAKIVCAQTEPYDFQKDCQIQRLSYASCKELIDRALLNHGICREKEGGCWYPIDEDTGECRDVRLLKAVSYPEEFFAENSLLLLPIPYSGSPFSVKEVVYDAGVLTCTIEYIICTENGGLSSGWSLDWSVFLELDTVLPQQTQLRREISRVDLGLEEYEQKEQEFAELYDKP